MLYSSYIKYSFLFVIFFQLSLNIGKASDNFDKEFDQKKPHVHNVLNIEKRDEARRKEFFSSCQKKADKGDVKSQVQLGELYENGLGVEKNPVLAFKCYQKAAGKNNMTAFSHLARCYSQGIGVQPNPEKAREYLAAFEFMKENNSEFKWDE